MSSMIYSPAFDSMTYMWLFEILYDKSTLVCTIILEQEVNELIVIIVLPGTRNDRHGHTPKHSPAW